MQIAKYKWALLTLIFKRPLTSIVAIEEKWTKFDIV